LSVAKQNHLPNALDNFEEIATKIHEKVLLLVLDYDGTLTPIVSRPELALLSDQTRELLRALVQKTPVAIISGRDRDDVERLVDIDDLLYAGSHGFDMAGFGGVDEELAGIQKFTDDLTAVERELEEKLSCIKGALIERKKYGVAAHYRQVAEGDWDHFKAVVDQVHSRYIQLKKINGKMVVEFQPDIDWNKGKALLWILKCLHFNSDNMITLYIGDDLTDEDAFKVLEKSGIGICVKESISTTHASYTLKNPTEVAQFLSRILYDIPLKN